MPSKMMGEMGEGVLLFENTTKKIISKTQTKEVNLVKRKIVNDVVL